MIMQRKVNLTLGYFASTSIRDLFMTPSYVYYTSNLIWMVPPGKAISSLEKLLKPFQFTVWVYFLIFLVSAFLTIGFLNFYSKKAMNFAFGENNGSPSLNIINIILGGSISKVPMRNFARTVLMVFMLYCLVLQNSYKGGLFKFMQTNMREREMRTTDEIIARNYLFYMLEASKAYLTELPKVMELSIFLDLENFSQMVEKVLEPDFKGVVLTSEDHLAYRNIQSFPNTFYRYAPETIFSNNIVVYMPKQSCLANEVDQIIIYLVNGGFISKWASLFFDRKFLKQQDQPKAASLTLKKFVGAFQLLFMGLSSCVIMFIIELQWQRINFSIRSSVNGVKNYFQAKK